MVMFGFCVIVPWPFMGHLFFWGGGKGGVVLVGFWLVVVFFFFLGGCLRMFNVF